MPTKIYTAQEVRKKAKVMLGGLGNGVITMPSQASSRDVAAMLRYAADVVERCDRQKSHLDGMLKAVDNELTGITIHQMLDTEKSIVDYILRGDAGKEEK